MKVVDVAEDVQFVRALSRRKAERRPRLAFPANRGCAFALLQIPVQQRRPP